MARMLARSHRHGMGCGRSRRCCVSSSYTRQGRPDPKLRRAQRAYEKQELFKDLREVDEASQWCLRP